MTKTSCKISDTEFEVKHSWVMNILIGLDQLGNTLAKGNPDATISARIGFNVHSNKGDNDKYWKTMEFMVNLTFYPIDGLYHCFRAWKSDENEIFNKGGFLSKLILFIITFISVITLFILIRIGVFFFPKMKNSYKTIDGKSLDLNEVNNRRSLN